MQTENTAAHLADFHCGNNFHCYRQFGVTFERDKDQNRQFVFRTFAPGNTVKDIFLVGDFNGWNETHPMKKITDDGVFEVMIPFDEDVIGTYYKYKIITRDGKVLFKADPFASYYEKSPKTASVVFRTQFLWNDENYLLARGNQAQRYGNRVPLNVYELHLGSWKRNPDGGFVSYADAAEQLIPYIKQLGYTHIKLLPVAEHPFDGSFGYQTTGFFAPTSRFGTPDDFRCFINRFHCAGIGVIADIDISSFPKDDHGLYEFDGSHVYEYSDESKREHVVRKTARFDFTRPEVISFVISVLNYWVEEFHLDGICICGTDSILDPECDRILGKADNVPGNPSEEGAAFLNNLCRYFSQNHNDVMLISDSAKQEFGFTHFVDAVMPGKFYNQEKSFLKGRISGITHDICNTLHNDDKDISRLFLTFLTMLPGGNVIFMGTEAQSWDRWDFCSELDWKKLLREGLGHLLFVRDLNRLYLSYPVLWSLEKCEITELDCENKGVFSLIRINTGIFSYKELLAVFNLSDSRYEGYTRKLHKKADCIEIFSVNNISHTTYKKGTGRLIRCDGDYVVKTDLEPHSAYIFEIQS